MSTPFGRFAEPEPFKLRPYALTIPIVDLPPRAPATVRLVVVPESELEWTQPFDVVHPVEPTIHAARPPHPVLDAAAWVLGLAVAPLRWAAHCAGRAIRRVVAP